MAILFVDSFDHYATADIVLKWRGASSGTASITTTNARRVNCMLLGNQAVRTFSLASSVSTVVLGFWHYTASSLAAAYNAVGSPIVRLSESGTHHLSVCVGSAGQIGMVRGAVPGTSLGVSSGGIISAGIGAYIEVKANIHDTTGSWYIRVNGTEVASGTGADTRNGGTSGVVTDVALMGLTNTSYMDDVYILDTAGSAPQNDFLGDSRVDCVFADADGTYTDFTPSTGVNHYALVDESSVNTTDYNSSGTSGHKDTYGFAALPTVTGATVYCAAVTIGALKDDAGAVNPYVATIRSNGTNADGATNFTPATTLEIRQEIFPTNPDGTVAWTKTTIDAAEFGIKIT